MADFVHNLGGLLSKIWTDFITYMQQAVDGEELVGEYRVLLPGTRRERRARQFNQYEAANSLEVGPAGHFSYSVNYRL